jgi:carboxypeptidase Q
LKTIISCLFSTLLLFTSPLTFAEEVDLEVIHRIKQEAFHHSQVMDYVHLIADKNGPRMSGSAGYRRAANVAMAAYKDAGIESVDLETWGTFGRGWDWTRVAVQMKQPQETTLSAFPADFSGATNGPVSGSVVFAPVWVLKSDAPENGDLEKLAKQIEVWKNTYRGKLSGKVVMMDHPVKFKLPEDSRKFRLNDEDLSKMGHSGYDGKIDPGPVPNLQWPLTAYPIDKEESSRIWDVMPLEFAADRWKLEVKVNNRIAEFLLEEGVVAVLKTGWAKGAGVIMHSDYGSIYDGDPVPPPSVVLMPEHYNRIHRLLEREVPVELEVDVDATFYPAADGLNVIAEIPGTARAGEVVMLGAHFDSWHGATGATDNASSSAVVMEVMRILKALNLPMRRTVRAGLWDGEEQCLCGSRGYVANHFADPVSMKLKPDHEKLSVYFNLDNGGGKIRGVYLQQNDMARPIFDAWLKPFADLGVSTVTIINTTGTDHLSFNAVGLPGFNFVQDPLDYKLNTHHSNVDDVGHLIPGDLMQAAAVMAASVYHAATRDEMMPRKQLPAALPPKNELPEILKQP